MDNRIARYYDDCLNLHGNSVQSLGWISEETQRTRFAALTTIGDLAGRRVLDAGCGLGNLYGYISETYGNVDYTGIDISQRMLEQARINYPGIEFRSADIFEYTDDRQFDYIFASGTFSIKMEDNYGFVERAVRKMWGLCTQGIAFNLLSSFTPGYLLDDFFFYYEPEVILKLCNRLTPYVVYRHDYLPNDMTLLLKR